MNVRKAKREDKSQLVDLIYKFDDYYIKNGIFSDRLKKFIDYKNKDSLFNAMVEEFLTNSVYFLFVAEEEGQLIGYICGDVKEKEHRILDKEGFIEDWFVLEDYRGKGIGRKLFEQLMQEFRQVNCNRVGLKAYASNKATIDMYHRMGFLDTDIIMAKELE